MHVGDHTASIYPRPSSTYSSHRQATSYATRIHLPLQDRPENDAPRHNIHDSSRWDCSGDLELSLARKLGYTRGQRCYTDALPKDVASTVEWRASSLPSPTGGGTVSRPWCLCMKFEITRPYPLPFHNAVLAVDTKKLEGDQPWLHGHTRGILS